ncbi:MAG: CHC2 zinc finger domain-containing protein [Acidimicrobiales bacterium]
MAGVDFEPVRARYRLGAVARSSGLVVPDTGRVKVCPLPAHDDQRPSVMHLDFDRERYYCFGCGARGDVVQWVCDVGVRPVQTVAILDNGRPLPRVGWIVARVLRQSGHDGGVAQRIGLGPKAHGWVAEAVLFNP